MIWIIGAGYMAKEYIKVLADLDVEFRIIGRSENSSKKLEEELKVEVISGGIKNYLKKKPKLPTHAIVCVPLAELESVTVTSALIEYGVPSILLEKPGAMTIEGIKGMRFLAEKNKSEVVIAYNRRFYQSVLAAEKLIEEDAGATAINFEITEWGHRVKDDPSSEDEKAKWVLANTSHVLDLVFFIGGMPSHLSSFTSGSLSWHKNASRFVGAGCTVNDILFSYMGYWDGPGRWSVEIVTSKNRYILRPMEKLAVQKLGSIESNIYDGVDYELDERYKPGLFLQTKAFINEDYSRFCTLAYQEKVFNFYYQIAGY